MAPVRVPSLKGGTTRFAFFYQVKDRDGRMDLLARRFIWRAGRKLYMWARKDQPNEMATNGECRLQRLVVDNMAASSRLIALDVGARIGDWSKSLLDAARGLPGGILIHAFEPVPDSRRTIAETLAGPIGSGQLRVNAIALSDTLEKRPMYVPHHQAGTSTLHPDSSVNYEQVLEVETSTADEYCRANSIDHIDLFKVDTEGNDLSVIRGASGLLKRGAIDVLQFEYNHRWVYSRTFLKDVFDLIEGGPYRLAKICSDALEVYTEWHPELERYFETNYALVHERMIGRLKCRVFRIGGGNACERVPLAS
jgi:FkbM family methyltransferase